MAKLHATVIRIHRIAAILFLLSVVPAGWASTRGGGEPAFLVYLPLLFLAGLTITGLYQLVAPWVRRARKPSA